MKKLSWLLLILTLVACGPAAVVTLTAISSTPSYTLETITATMPATLTPTHNFVLTPTTTWTPLPTLSVEERATKIEELLETNGGCQLPCWWGIAPNKTTWAEALHFLSPFMSYMKQGHPNEVSQNGKLYIYQEINIYFLTPNGDESVIWFTTRDGTVLGMSIFPPATEYKYQLHQILNLLGIPKDVYIVAQSTSMMSELPPATLVLDYSNIGVIASIDAYEYLPRAGGEKLLVCPQPVGAGLELDDPTLSSAFKYTIEQNVERLGGNRGRGRIIEEATNMTTDSFYNTFIDPASKACLETPANLWP